MARINVVVFDIGGVLVRAGRTWADDARQAGILLDAEWLDDFSERLRELPSRSRGEIQGSEFYELVAERSGGRLSVRDARAISAASLVGEYRGIGTVIDVLEDAGIEIAVLSNANAEEWGRLFPRPGTAAEFPNVARIRNRFGSHLLRVEKPDSRAYAEVTRALGCEQHEVLYFDDRAENVAAARDAGWSAELIDDSGDTADQVLGWLRVHGLLQRRPGTASSDGANLTAYDATLTGGAPGPVFHPSVQKAIGKLQDAVAASLGQRLVGIYLTGSVASGDYEPGISDIDLLVITAGTLPPAEVVRLEAMHSEFAADAPEWDDRIEAVYVAADDLRAFRTSRPRFPVISPGEPFHLRDEPLADWSEYWYLVRHGAVALVGPPPPTAIPDITRDEFLVGVRNYVDELAGRIAEDARRTPGEESYMVLTACRALCAFETGRQASKRSAGNWLKTTYPAWTDLVDRALRWRSGRSVDVREVRPDTGQLLQFVLKRLSIRP